MLHKDRPTAPLSQGQAAITASSKNDAKQVKPLLTVKELDTLACAYVDLKELTNDTVYSSANLSTFFESQVFQLLVNKLLQHAAYGEKDQVDEMLKKNPWLLEEKGTVTDYSGRTHYQRAVYQIALGAVDRDVTIMKDGKAIKVVDGMVEMIEEHFKRLPNKTPEEIERIRKQQYDEQFPADSEAKEEKRKNDDSFALNAVVSVIASASDNEVQRTNALEDEIHNIIRKEKSDRADSLRAIVQSIMKAKTDEAFKASFNNLESYLKTNGLIKVEPFNFGVLKAIYQFRNYLEPKEKCTTGKHFNHHLLAEAATLYDTNYWTFGDNMSNERWGAPKNRMCWQKVFGYVERFVPACDAQVIAQGVWNVVENGEKSMRALGFRHGGDAYFPLLSDPDWEFGFNCAHGGGGVSRSCFEVGGSIFVAYVRFQNLCLSKTTVIREATQQLDNYSKKPASQRK